MIHPKDGFERTVAVKFLRSMQKYLEGEIEIVAQDILEINDFQNLDKKFLRLQSKYQALKGLNENVEQQLNEILEEA